MTQQIENTASEKGGRLVSLDVLRGMAIAGMMMVNNHGPGSEVYTQIEHAPWNGCTFADWVFPTFLFVVGVAMTFSFSRRAHDASQKKALYGHVLKRTAVLFLLGIVLNAISYNNFPFFFPSTVRIPGVLQRIAACYLVVSLILLNCKIRGQAVWAIGLVVAYWLMLELIPVPGYGAGVLQPAGSLEWYVDSHLFKGHTYVYAPTPGFDPEGLVSTIPAIATTLFGALTGQWLRSDKPQKSKANWMLAAGVVLTLVGAVLGIWMPINKNLWTSSYAVFMTGIDLVCFGILYWFIDIRGFKKWAIPFVIYGMNAISVYFLSDIVAKLLAIIEWESSGATISLRSYIYQNLLLQIVSPINASLVYAISFMLLMYLIAWIMWRRKWFIKI
ncbi:MAG TPA: heparan-alpha-glucosaminide N-acetyltransferase domain-containing protein [Bacteroidota bacterium]|nr:heparan-alpha-glucosaminide N-acetyltransferase domain-containing protein [Bacteroidota bacterium]